MGPVDLKQWWRDRRPGVLSNTAYFLARTIGRSLRLQAVGYEKIKEIEGGKIICGWHGRTVIPANFFKGQGLWAIISLSRDGEMQTRIFKKFGFNVVRGSTGRGGARVLVEAIRILRNGGTMAITPDGPRGPMGVVQPGVLMMAQKSGAALVPVGSHARHSHIIKSWDRFQIPWLFSKAFFVFGEPMYVPKDASEEEIEAIRVRFEASIHEVQTRSETL